MWRDLEGSRRLAPSVCVVMLLHSREAAMPGAAHTQALQGLLLVLVPSECVPLEQLTSVC